MSVLEVGSSRLIVTYPDELISEAASKMLRYDIGRLPVVDRADPGKPVGYLSRRVMAARLRGFHNDTMRTGMVLERERHSDS